MIACIAFYDFHLPVYLRIAVSPFWRNNGILISEVAHDWRELMVRQCTRTVRQVIAGASGRRNPSPLSATSPSSRSQASALTRPQQRV